MPFRHVALILLLMLSLAACGKKGPLYLPEPPADRAPGTP